MINGMDYKCEWNIKSEPTQVPPFLREMLGVINKRLEIRPEELADIKLIFSELLVNAIIHGNDSDHNKRLHIRLTIGSRFVCASIMDEGGGFSEAGFIEKSKHNNSMQQENGRGMKIVRALADEVKYSSNGRQVTFIKKVGIQDG